jgi:catechol 2,3-dioxygenase-like lactoylglutathione lyase family enzyme
VKLNQVTIGVSDFERSKAFYIALGLKLIVDSPPRYARFIVPGNEATFSIEADGGSPGRHSDRTHLYFECDDLDARCEALAAKGFVFAEKPADKAWLWREAKLLDPDGREIILYFAGENRLNPPWRIKD